MDLLARQAGPRHGEVSEKADDFISFIEQQSAESARSYDLPVDHVDMFVILTSARLSDNFYLVGRNNWAVVALGGWHSEFAPPSIVEYYLSMVTVSAIDAASVNLERHFLTRGCSFDFNASLSDTRFSVLSGNICSECQAKITAKCGGQFTQDALMLLNRDWLGDADKPLPAAVTVKKLGFDLFRTAGVTPTLKERLLTAFEQEGLKNALSITFQLLLAAAIVVLGLKK